MRKKILLFFILLVICTCTNNTISENKLEVELNSIVKGEALDIVIEKEFKNFTVDWDNGKKWESDCIDYKIIPNRDTFKYTYYLDFCHNEYRWWTRNVVKND